MAVTGYLSDLADRTAELQGGRRVEQAGAICFRTKSDHEKEVLLLTSRGTGRWVIPKGNIHKDESLRKCAAREAMEEAGVSGKVSKEPLGFYSYIKFDAKPVHFVTVFVMRVDTIKPGCDESDERKYAWLPISEAASLVDEPELSGLFRLFAKQKNKTTPPKRG